MIIKRVITAVSAAVLMMSPVAVNVQAAEETLSSGVKVSEIESKVKEILEDKTYPSLGTAVFTKDETLYTGFFGNVDQEEGIPADEDTVYDWGSITKTLTWVSVMQLYEQGKIDLNADIRTYLPDGFLRHLKYDDSITMMDLMNHTAGWCETAYTVWADKESDITDLGTMLRDVEPAQIFHPGEVNTYSNFGAALAGYIVERVSGQDYIGYVNENIFEPLGMEHTSVAPAYTDNEWVRERSLKLKGYTLNPMSGEIVFNGMKRCFCKPYPAGSACGTVTDFVKYGQALLDDSAPLFEKPETQEMMLSGSLFTGDTDIMVNSYGFWCDHRDVDTLGHDGGTIQGSSNFVFDRVSGCGIISMTNGDAGAEAVYTLPDLVFGESSDTDVPEQEITERDDISGKYVNTRFPFKGFYKGVTYFNILALRNIADIEKVDDDSYVIDLAGEKSELKRIGNGLYRVSGEYGTSVVSIDKASDGNIIVHSMANDLVSDNSAPIKGLLAVYYLYAGAVVFLLFIVKIVLKATQKLKPYAGSKLILAAQIAKFTVLVSFILLNLVCRLGITKPIGAAWSIINMVCGVLCAAAVLSDIRCLVSKVPEKGSAWKYILNIVFNVLTVIAVIWLEMYCFWGI